MRLLPLKAFCLLVGAASLLLPLPATSAKATQGPIIRFADLAVVIWPQLGPVRVGSFLTLHLQFTNFGPAATFISPIDAVAGPILSLPPKAVFVNSTPMYISPDPFFSEFFSGVVLSGNLPSLRPGESTILRVTVKPLAPGLLIFEAFTGGPGSFMVFDPDLSNNRFTQYIWVEP